MVFALIPLFWLFYLQQAVQSSPPHLIETSQRLATRDGASPYFQRLVIAHGVISVVGFAVGLPAGVILARYLRTFRPWWYTGHWFVQFGTSGPIILVGLALGYTAHLYKGAPSCFEHWTWGSMIFGLYLAQCALGAFIHYIKPKKSRQRPPQNYLHALLGIVVIGLGMYQIRTGYDSEWPRYVERGRLPGGVNTLWIVWSVMLVVIYAAGMWFIPRQYRQEGGSRNQIGTVRSGENDYIMGEGWNRITLFSCE
ncbi:hypothetical protein B0H11DRAFT_1845525 [Mycena galericulata]|nr:hypothetical protein B0H11DRAFT_1845525 [Mycena galericulata]